MNPQVRNLLQEVVFSWQKSRQWTQLRLAQGWLHLASPPAVSKKNAGNRKSKTSPTQMSPTNSTKWAFTAAFLAAAFFFLLRLRLLGLSQVEESRSGCLASPQPKTSSSGSSVAAGGSGALVLGRYGGWKLKIGLSTERFLLGVVVSLRSSTGKDTASCSQSRPRIDRGKVC